MTDTPDPQATAPSSQIDVPAELLFQGYQRELAALTQRAVQAEAQVYVLQHRIAMQQAMLHQHAPAPES